MVYINLLPLVFIFALQALFPHYAVHRLHLTPPQYVKLYYEITNSMPADVPYFRSDVL